MFGSYGVAAETLVVVAVLIGVRAVLLAAQHWQSTHPRPRAAGQRARVHDARGDRRRPARRAVPRIAPSECWAMCCIHTGLIRRLRVVSLFDVKIAALDGSPLDTGALDGTAVLVVNVASRCGLTPQYRDLEELQERYAGRGFTVLGVPCNQFGGQEPGTAEEIATFCSTTYGVTFPLTEKVEVNGPGRHPLFEELTAAPDAEGTAGDVQWNFEKFLVGPDGRVRARFRPRTPPTSPEVVAAVEAALPR